jgi:long-chain acyl-CoA synthetase
MAGMFQGMTAVALYDTLGENALKFIGGQTELRTVVVEDSLVESLCKMKTGDDPLTKLENLIVMGPRSAITAAQEKMADEVGVKLYTFQEVVDEGVKYRKENGPLPVLEPTPDDVYMLSYTSGTTGVPKGVKLTQRMILNAAQSVNERVRETPGGGGSPDDAYLSYLPLAHSFEQCLFGCSLIFGTRVGFYSGNLLALTSDLEAL